MKVEKILFLSSIISLVFFVALIFIGSKMLPYQNAPGDLQIKYDQYVKTYTPVWNVLIVFEIISVTAILISSVVLLIKNINKTKRKEKKQFNIKLLIPASC